MKQRVLSEADFVAAAKPVLAAAEGRAVDKCALRNEIISLLSAVGLWIEDEFDDEFEQIARARQEASTPLRMEARYNRLRLASDEFVELFLQGKVSASAIQRRTDDVIRGELIALLRARKLIAPNSRLGLDADPQEVRKLAGQRRRFFRGQTKPGAPLSRETPVLLRGLGAIFLTVSGSNQRLDDLGHAEGSRFVTFAHAILRKYGWTRASLTAAWRQQRALIAHELA